MAHLVTISGCYQPDVVDCTIQCSAPTDCAGAQICRGDGWCAVPDAPACKSTGDDDNSSATPDARPAAGDAADLCQQGCTNGMCMGGVCVIDCGAPNACQSSDIKCPANLPCRVICGDGACTKKVMCEQASSCEVRCTGESSCQDDILCNSNRCDVDCIGASSCKRVKCTDACACDVSCTGMGSCRESSECPDATCQLGNGCSSLLAGCSGC